jgi:hypothetical protein
MAIIVVGGQARNSGKTSVVSAIIAAWPERGWTAVKISAHWHEQARHPRDKAADAVCRIDEELNAGNGTDTGRYLAAGASRSFWIRVREGRMQQALASMKPVLQSSPNVIIESNGIVRYLKPELYLMALRFDIGDFKESARATLPQAHAIAAVGCGEAVAARERVRGMVAADVPVFPIPDPQKLTPELSAFIKLRMDGSA